MRVIMKKKNRDVKFSKAAPGNASLKPIKKIAPSTWQLLLSEYFPKQRLLLVKEKMYQDKILTSHIWVSLELYMATHSSTLAWEIPWTEEGAWWATVHRVAKCRTQLSDFTFTFHSHALETEMATHSSVLAWRIPGTEEPGGLLSMGLHRVRHNWSDLTAAAELYRNLLLLLWWFGTVLTLSLHFLEKWMACWKLIFPRRL